jgi:hypothetical protein
VSPFPKQIRPAVEVNDGRVRKGGVMDPWINLDHWRERNRELLREVEQRRLAQEVRAARREKGIEVRWSIPGDEHKIADLLELNGRPRWEAFEERFIVAEEKGKLLSALPYQTTSKRLWVGMLVTDPWVKERPLAVALYAGAGNLAREIGVGEVLAAPVSYANYPREAGYLRCGPWWLLDTTRPDDCSKPPGGAWRRMVALLCRAFRR